MNVKTQTVQSECYKLAAAKFPGLEIEGDGYCAVVDNACQIVFLVGDYQSARVRQAEAFWRRDIYLLKIAERPHWQNEDDGWEPKEPK
jgi:hypothetical protein